MKESGHEKAEHEPKNHEEDMGRDGVQVWEATVRGIEVRGAFHSNKNMQHQTNTRTHYYTITYCCTQMYYKCFLPTHDTRKLVIS